MNDSILIVDDDADQVTILQHWFIKAGYRVVGVTHPRQALEAASVRQFQFALIDASLPEIDGLELMSRLQRIQGDLNVVILSGYDYPQERAKTAGAYAFMTKPASLPRMQAIIEAARCTAFAPKLLSVMPQATSPVQQCNRVTLADTFNG